MGVPSEQKFNLGFVVIFLLGAFYFVTTLNKEEIRGDKPPTPILTAGEKQIPISLGTYVWKGVADAIWDWNKIAERRVVVSPETEINIQYDYKPNPEKLYITKVEQDKNGQWQGYGFTEPPLSRQSFVAPKEKGIYLFVLLARWKNEGEADYAFAVEVK